MDIKGEGLGSKFVRAENLNELWKSNPPFSTRREKTQRGSKNVKSQPRLFRSN